MAKTTQLVRWFGDICNDDVPFVGGKNASLGEMYQRLSGQDVKVPNGFAVTAEAYRHVLHSAAIENELRHSLDGLDDTDTVDLAHKASHCRTLIYEAGIPQDLQDSIKDAYEELEREYGADLTVAVRSSATAEDLPEASFAGQHDSFLHISGVGETIDACRHCFASLFTDRAIEYRIQQGIDHFDVALSIAVMKMVRSDIGASGVLFSVDTESGFDQVVFITAAYGLGENVVKGAVDPDEFYVHKPTFNEGFRRVLRRKKGSKEIKMVCGADCEEPGSTTHNVDTTTAERQAYSLSDAEVLVLADYAIKIENHYSQRARHTQAMDVEWARDGLDNELYIVQARPETVVSNRSPDVLTQYRLDTKATPVTTGSAVGAQIASGMARVIERAEQLSEFQAGEILIADITTPDWGVVMNVASALVTNRGGRTCHAAIVARELGIPAIVGCGDATQKIQTGDLLTISCTEGDVGKVYSGKLPFSVEETDLSGLERPKTQMMLNIANPDQAFKTAMLPNDGVGLARLEFIITEYVKAHPMALVHPDRITDPAVKQAILELTANHETPADFFIDKLAEGAGTLAAAFYPKPVIVRMSDFKSNEYASLLGGRDFEAKEENPMIGFRGASRYAHPAYADGFALECAAMKRVREVMGLTNLKLMIPFCRRVEEGIKVLQVMADHGLARGVNGLEIYIMCEIPNNVIQIDEFAKHFDGFSIGSNDLTQLTLGVDRDSDILASEFDERDPGVLKMCAMAIEGARRNHRHSGICGQAPSDYPEIAEWLVQQGIDSLSLNPDTILQVTRRIVALEKNQQGNKEATPT
ncbi:MAG: phosphoenolpyruvate synthase [Pseudomonadales bacterium]